MTIEFTRPYVLLAIPVIVALLVFSLRFLYVRSKTQKISYIIVRAIVASLLVLALSGLNVKLKDKFTATIFLVDASDSVKNSRSDMIRFVNDALKSRKKYDNIGVVAFGDGSSIEQFLSQTPSFSEIQTSLKKSATNIENAIQTAISMIPDGYAGRIVLLTDGIENEGAMKNTVPSIITTKCLLEVKKYGMSTDQEAYVSNLIVPQHVDPGEKFVITVEIESNTATNATVNLYSGRTLKGRRSVTLQPGKNKFVFEDTQTEEGLKTYRVMLEAENDSVSVNNEYMAYTDISRKKPILVVEGKAGASKDFERLLESLGADYEIVQPVTVPTGLSDLKEFSSVVFIDVYSRDLREGFMETLETYVKDFAGGFIATGGPNSYALGAYKNTPLETILPVKMDLDEENEVPEMAIMMVIDHSGSMSDGNGTITNLDLAKNAAIAAVEELRRFDSVGVIAFDDSFSRVVPLQKAENKNAIKNDISKIEIAGGTSIYPALEAAAKDLSKSKAAVKHIILLTDGEDGMDYPSYGRLLDYINDELITLTTVSIGEYSNNQLLDALAKDCHGRSYHTDINTDVPRIFAQEIYLSVHSFLVNEEFTPVINANDPILTHVLESGLPNLLGYVATTKKERASQLLGRGVDKDSDGLADKYDPILCTWQYGLGKTVAWTSDVMGKWSANYSGWEKYQQLWSNLLQYVTTENSTEGLTAEVKQNGNKATINFTTENASAGTSVVATIADDNGNIHDVKLDPTSPGSFTTDFTMNSNGVYSINLKQYEGDELVGNINTAAIMQYSLEYRFYDISTTLDEFIKSIGGNVINEASEVFNESLDLVRKQKDLSSGFLVAAVLLFMLDIFIRRFRVNFIGQLAKLPAGLKESRQNKPVKVKKTAPVAPVAETIKEQPVQKPLETIPAEKPVEKPAEKRVEKHVEKPAEKKAPEKERLNTSELMKNLRR